MDILYMLYNEILYRPLFNGLVFIYSVSPLHDLGLSIVLLTVAVRLILFPATLRAFKSQSALKAIQPKMKEIQDGFKGNKEEQAKRIMALYAESKINPFSGCLPILIQLPVFIALYQIFWKGIDPAQFTLLYSFVASPEGFSAIAFGTVDLMRRNIFLAVLAGIAQFLQVKFIPQPEIPTPKSAGAAAPDLSKILSLQMKFVFPVLIVMLSLSLPSALPLYWTTMSLLAIVEQVLMRRRFK